MSPSLSQESSFELDGQQRKMTFDPGPTNGTNRTRDLYGSPGPPSYTADEEMVLKEPLLYQKIWESLNSTEQNEEFPNDPLRDFTEIRTHFDFQIPASQRSIVFWLLKSDHKTDLVSSPRQYHVRWPTSEFALLLRMVGWGIVCLKISFNVSCWVVPIPLSLSL